MRKIITGKDFQPSESLPATPVSNIHLLFSGQQTDQFEQFEGEFIRPKVNFSPSKRGIIHTMSFSLKGNRLDLLYSRNITRYPF